MKSLLILFTLLSSYSALAKTKGPLNPMHSACLESATLQTLDNFEDAHVVRDSKTNRITRVIDLISGENFDLAYLSYQKGVEYISFENETHLLNIWAKPIDGTKCQLIEVRIDLNDSGI